MIMIRTSITKLLAVTAVGVVALGIGLEAYSRAYKTGDLASAAAAAARVASTAQADEETCSNATLNSPFAFTSTGFITPPAPAPAQPFAIVGAQTFDGNGAFTAAGTVSLNGKLIPVTLAGTYTVNPDCTGTLTAQISPVSITTHLFFVIDDHRK